MAKLLCERCGENYAGLRVYVTDIEERVLEADRVCLDCIAVDNQGNIEVDIKIGTAAVEAARRAMQDKGKEA